jgi:hypothetical protein
MGRHSAPDDESPDAAAATTTTIDLGSLDLDSSGGRHAQPSGAGPPSEDEQHTQVIAAVDPDVAVDDTHDTDAIVPLEPDVIPLEPAPPKPSRADRKAQKKADKAAAARAAAATAPPKPPKVDLQKAPRAASATPKTKKKKNGETDTQADLRVLRENSAVRARSLAAVLVSFLLYTVVMIVIGYTGAYLMWIWIPIVVSGVLVGVVLDLAHRQSKCSADEPPPLEPLG